MKWYEYPPSASREFYHYTSFDGVMSILRSRTIWATSIYYLNDEREFRYGYDVITRNLERIGVAKSWREGRKFLGTVQETVSHWGIPNLFVSAFSYEADLLSQWRAYCPNGRGVAIGFTAKLLAERARSQGFQFLPCLYDSRQYDGAVASVVSGALNEVGIAKPLNKELVERTSKHLQILAARIKHVAFEEEQEWRLIGLLHADDTRIDYRSNRSLLVPYQNFTLGESDENVEIGRIIVGPNPHIELALRAITGFVQSRDNLICTGVVPSSAPYRAW